MAINPANQLLLLLLLLLLFLSWLHTIQAQEVTGVCKEYKTGPCLSARALTIVFADKHNGQGECQRVPVGEHSN